MIVIADTSPINYLILINRIDLLPTIFGRVIIPQAVRQELSRSAAPLAVQAWALQPPAWTDVCTVSRVTPVKGLGLGELEAITLAERMKADLLLLDDADARKIAVARGLTITGTIGVLERAALRGLIDLEKALVELRQSTTCYITDSLIAAAMERVRQGKRTLQ